MVVLFFSLISYSTNFHNSIQIRDRLHYLMRTYKLLVFNLHILIIHETVCKKRILIIVCIRRNYFQHMYIIMNGNNINNQLNFCGDTNKINYDTSVIFVLNRFTVHDRELLERFELNFFIWRLHFILTFHCGTLHNQF